MAMRYAVVFDNEAAVVVADDVREAIEKAMSQLRHMRPHHFVQRGEEAEEDDG